MTTGQKPLTPTGVACIEFRNEHKKSRPEDIGNLVAYIRRLHRINLDLRAACKAQTGGEAGTTHYEKLSMKLGSATSQREWLLNACKMFVAAEDIQQINDARDIAITAVAKAEKWKP